MDEVQKATKRLFLAASAEALKPTLDPWLRKLRVGADRKDLDVRWIPPELLHITTVFFGATDAALIDPIAEKVREITKTTAPFRLKIEGMGGFPDLRATRVMWFGVQNSRAWRALRDRLADDLRELSPNLDGGADPHLTIGRLRNTKSVSDLLSPFIRSKFGRLEVSELLLIESIQQAPFPVYKIVQRFSLLGTNAEDETNEMQGLSPEKLLEGKLSGDSFPGV